MNLGANHQDSDLENLARFGYRQQLQRAMGLTSSFALSFSVVSVTTGLFANYAEGLRLAGPAFIWTWPLVGAGQFLVALVFAQLARQIPVTGYAYQWTRALAGPRLAWWAGWMMIIQFLTGMPGVCYAFANYLLPYLGLPQENRWVVLMTVGVLVLIAFINHRGITLASLVNNVSVAAEILGTVVAGVLLLYLATSRHVNSWDFLLARSNSASGPEYLQGFALSSVLSAWTLTGFETAANLAEETHNPQGFIPKAIVYSELSSVAIGFLVLVGFTLAIPSLDTTMRSETPLLLIMQSHLTPLATHIIMAFVFISIFASALANLTTLSRMVWAMARDHELPGSRWLSHVSSHGVPTTAIWVVTLLSVLFVLWAKFIIVMTGTASLAGYITYALIVGSAVWASRKRRPRVKDMQAGEGGTRTAANVPILPRGLTAAALVWLVTILAMLGLPGSARRNVLALGATILAGALCYLLRDGRRERTGS